MMTRRSKLSEVALYFLRLGVTAFGGPAAHIAMMREEAVTRRKWLDDQRFLDLLGATNLIPGPNSTEMAIHIGFQQAGWMGLILGGVFFILPSTLIVLFLAWLYVRFGAYPAAGWLLYGVKPVIIAVIAQALWGLGKKAIKGALTLLSGLAVLTGSFLGLNPLLLLFAGGLFVMTAENLRLKRAGPSAPALIPAVSGKPFTLVLLFLKFLKVGAVLYGSGYVLLAFLHADFVARLGWLTDRQLLDAIAVGQVTPGPVFTTATFIGYVLGGVLGAVLATVAIFLPSFVFVALSSPFVPRLRRSAWASGFLDGVNVSALGLMAAVTYQLGKAAFIDPFTVLLAVASGIMLLRFKVNSTWLVLAGSALGILKGVIAPYI